MSLRSEKSPTEKSDFSTTDGVTARFWPRVQRQPEGCWLWTGATSRGYGVLSVAGRRVSAHVYSYVLHRGGHTAKSERNSCTGCLRNRCGVRCCVNPEHWFRGGDGQAPGWTVVWKSRGSLENRALVQVAGEAVADVRTVRKVVTGTGVVRGLARARIEKALLRRGFVKQPGGAK